MRKLIVVQHCGEVGGSGIGLLAVLNMLKDRFDIIVYCVHRPNSMVQLLKNNGFIVETVSSIPLFPYYNGGPRILSVDFLLNLQKIPNAKKQWSKIFKEENPDVVLLNSMTLSWMIPVIKDYCNAKAICHVREVLPNRKSLRGKFILKRLERAYAVWFISDNEKRYFQLKSPITHVIRDSLSEPRLRICNRCIRQTDEASFHVLFVGGISALKGIGVLLKTIKHLNNGIVVNIAGNLTLAKYRISFKAGLMQNLKSLFFEFQQIKRKYYYRMLFNMKKRYPTQINIIGYQDNLDEAFSKCDVLVFPSIKPHQSRPAFEVGFYGKPVIISDFHETSENIKNGYNGITFIPNNANSLANAINYLASNPKLCRELGKHNYDEAMKKNTFEVVSAEMLLFWHRCAEKNEMSTI